MVRCLTANETRVAALRNDRSVRFVRDTANRGDLSSRSGSKQQSRAALVKAAIFDKKGGEVGLVGNGMFFAHYRREPTDESRRQRPYWANERGRETMHFSATKLGDV
jgi:hypothetical protein